MFRSPSLPTIGETRSSLVVYVNRHSDSHAFVSLGVFVGSIGAFLFVVCCRAERGSVARMGNFLESFELDIPRTVCAYGKVGVYNEQVGSILFSASIDVVEGSGTSTIVTICPFAPRPIVARTMVVTTSAPMFIKVNNKLAGNRQILNLNERTRCRNTFNIIMGTPAPGSAIGRLGRTLSVPIVIAIISRRSSVTKEVRTNTRVFGMSTTTGAPRLVRGVHGGCPSVPVVTANNPASRAVGTAVTTNTGTMA